MLALVCAPAGWAAEVTGTWRLPSGSNAAQTWVITAGTGTLAGEGTGGSYTWPIEGTLSGNSVQVRTAYRNSGYVAYFVGAVSADGAKMSGTWATGSFAAAQTSSNTWTANRDGGAPGGGGGGGPTPGTPTGPGSNNPNPACLDAKTLLATCADPAVPGFCKAGGPIYPQCMIPAAPPYVCGPSNSILPTCVPPDNYVMACGGIGTILPQCAFPPPQLPQVCGPTGTLLPACSGVNNPILVCGGSGTALPVCNFGGPIDATPLGDGNGEIDLTVSCPADLADISSAPPGARASQAKKKCDGTARLESLRSAHIATLRAMAPRLGNAFNEPCGEPACTDIAQRTGIAPATIRSFHAINRQVFVTRAEREIRYWFPSTGLPRQLWVNRGALTGKMNGPGTPPYQGPGSLRGAYPYGYFAPEYRFADATAILFGEYRKLYVKVKGQVPGVLPFGENAAKKKKAKARKWPALLKPVSKRISLPRGKRRTKVRLKLTKRQVRALKKSVPKGAKRVPVRIAVSFKTKTIPVVRYVDTTVKIKP